MTDKHQLETLLKTLPKRSLQNTLFNLAHAYARSADASWTNLSATKDSDFAAPAIMCLSFAVELLLKFFLTVDHPTAKTIEELKRTGVKLKCHKYSELYDQLLPDTQDKIAETYSNLSGNRTDASGFRQALIAQGDDPFVYWRYVYETDAISHFDIQAFHIITDALGKAAEAHRKAMPNS